MAHVMQIVSRVDDVPTEHDGKWFVAFEYLPPGSGNLAEFGGGQLHTTEALADARRFEDTRAVMECWRQAHGTRADGQPNRPLTVFHVATSRVAE